MTCSPTRPAVAASRSAIGRATALGFAEAGAHVLVVGRREGPLKEMAALHPHIEIVAVDVCADGTPAEIVRTVVARWGRLKTTGDESGFPQPRIFLPAGPARVAVVRTARVRRSVERGTTRALPCCCAVHPGP
ncbi:SDR family oxidoreductase [Streptomyces longwoodensis]|uniref:SDR family oxidoreductase n=1 Tax=Streptomyces longwoodensis TaxID=68231 RepID=UPI0034013296